jgi:hypothetical protein
LSQPLSCGAAADGRLARRAAGRQLDSKSGRYKASCVETGIGTPIIFVYEYAGRPCSRSRMFFELSACEPACGRPLRSGAPSPPLPGRIPLCFAYNAAFDEWTALSEGAYLLRSNITDWSDQQLWKAYIQLTQAEAACRIQKDQLNVRPIRSGTSARTGFRPISSCAFLPSCCGRAARCGSSAQALETHRVRSSMRVTTIVTTRTAGRT